MVLMEDYKKLDHGVMKNFTKRGRWRYSDHEKEEQTNNSNNCNSGIIIDRM